MAFGAKPATGPYGVLALQTGLAAWQSGLETLKNKRKLMTTSGTGLGAWQLIFRRSNKP